VRSEVRAEITKRFRKFQLGLYYESTRLPEFGPFAVENRKSVAKGEAKAETLTVSLYADLWKEKGNVVHGCGRRNENGYRPSAPASIVARNASGAGR